MRPQFAFSSDINLSKLISNQISHFQRFLFPINPQDLKILPTKLSNTAVIKFCLLDLIQSSPSSMFAQNQGRTMSFYPPPLLLLIICPRSHVTSDLVTLCLVMLCHVRMFRDCVHSLCYGGAPPSFSYFNHFCALYIYT